METHILNTFLCLIQYLKMELCLYKVYNICISEHAALHGKLNLLTWKVSLKQFDIVTKYIKDNMDMRYLRNPAKPVQYFKSHRNSCFIFEGISLRLKSREYLS